MSRIVISVLLLTAWAASAQTASLVWQPPSLDLPDTIPPATVSREMIATLRVAGMQIILEQTPLNDVQKRLGGVIGQHGEASNALQWLCYHGADAKGRWALWLESSEMGGGNVDGFSWRRIARNATLDRRCRERDVEVDLPVGLVMSMTETQVREVLGRPTAKYRNTLIFDHEHEVTLRNQPFTTSNNVYVTLRSGLVWTVQVRRTTSD